MEAVPINDKKVEIDQKTLECVTRTRTCWRYTSMISSAFLYIGLMLFPFIAECIIASQMTYEHSGIMVLICGIVQTIIAAHGGIRLSLAMYDCCTTKNPKKDNDKHCAAFWCGRPTDFSTLLSGGYIVYALPPWFLTNAIISWVIINNKVVLPFYTHLMIYMPLIAYPTFIFVGYAIKKAGAKDDYIEV
jgi:hypothetical protein